MTDKNSLVKNLFLSQNISKNHPINREENDHKKKKDYLDHNNISYDDVEIEIEKEKKNGINLTDSKNKRNNKSYKGLKDIKDIKMNVKIMNTNDDYKSLINKNKKKKYKSIVDQFEFLLKIKKEFKILRKSKDKDKLSNKN